MEQLKNKKRSIKIKKEEFLKAVALEMMTLCQFAEKVDSQASYISRIYSNTRSSVKCSPKFAKRVLLAFENKYMFEDLFFWV